MGRRLPEPTYLPFPAMLILQAMVWLTENRIIADRRISEFLGSLPLGWMWVAVGAFSLGLLVQDFRNPRSYIRTRWRAANRIMSLGEFLLTGYRHGYSFSVAVVAERRAKVITLTSRFTAVESLQTRMLNKKIRRWRGVKDGEKVFLPLASVSAPMHGSDPVEMVWWGIDEETEWGAGDRDIRHQPQAIMHIDIEARHGWRTQREKLYAICRNYGTASAQFTIWNEAGEILYTT